MDKIGSWVHSINKLAKKGLFLDKIGSWVHEFNAMVLSAV